MGRRLISHLNVKTFKGLLYGQCEYIFGCSQEYYELDYATFAFCNGCTCFSLRSMGAFLLSAGTKGK